MGYLFLFLLLIVHGIREGYTWADSNERKNNIFICDTLGIGKAKIDYHGWRSIEYLLIILIAVLKLDFVLVVSIFLMAQFPYNGILHKICTNKFFYTRKTDFHWMGIVIKKHWLTWRTDILLLFVGIVLFLSKLSL